MNPAIDAPPPHLQPPGAGLPRPELLVARVLLAFTRWRGNRETFTARFKRERTAVRRQIEGLDAVAGARRVLIRRVPGMEDSSRFWSVWMTLDHLRMVHVAFARVIESLAAGVVPEKAASTAAVKPDPAADAGIVPVYEASCDALVAAAAVSDLKTKARYVHPWFGPLDAEGWYALAGVHLGIHREQIRRILA